MFKSFWPTNAVLVCCGVTIGRRKQTERDAQSSKIISDPEDNLSTGGFVVKRKLLWTVENFDEIRQSQDLIKAQQLKICAGDGGNFQTEWLCYLKSEADNAKEIGIFFELTKAPCTEVIASVNAKIIGNISMSPVLRTFTVSSIGGQGWGWNIPEKNLTTSLTGGLRIELEIKLFSNETVGNIIEMGSPVRIQESFDRKFSEKLREDFAKLLENPLKTGNSQTKIISRDSKEFVVNREILSARSPVFETMFQTDMKESKTGIVQVSDLSSKTLTVLLHFMYTGSLHKKWRSSRVIPELVYAASKYQLPDLLEFMDQIIGHVCKKENAAKLIVLSRQLGLRKAEGDLVRFMKKLMNTFDEIVAFAGESSGM